MQSKKVDYQDFQENLLSIKKYFLCRLDKISKDKTRVNGPLEANLTEQSLSLENNEVVDALDNQLRHKLQDVEISLKRIEQGTYGLCLACNKKIHEVRLRALPYALRCTSCEHAYV